MGSLSPIHNYLGPNLGFLNLGMTTSDSIIQMERESKSSWASLSAIG